MESRDSTAPARICASCGMMLADDAGVCSGCGSEVLPATQALPQQAATPEARMACQWCGAGNPLGSEVCSSCGARFPSPEYDAELLRQAAERRSRGEIAQPARRRGLLGWLFG